MKSNVATTNTGLNCRVCGVSISGARKHQVREMFFGSREQFCYVECSSCGSLQIEKIPTDLSRFYPANYYAQAAPIVYKESLLQRTRCFFRGKLTLNQLGCQTLTGNFINSLHPAKNPLPQWLDSRYLNLTLDSRILDIGCGNGSLLATLRRFGFRRLAGIDPFIKADIDCDAFKIHRTALEQFQGKGYDFIMLHHVLEHLPVPSESLRQLAKMLAPDGCMLIRTPVANCYAWRHYGADWVQLDAPRHLVLFTTSALKLLAQACGLEMCGMYFDSNAFQFWGSEQYRRDIPLDDPRSVFLTPPLGQFMQSEMDEFIRQSAEANQNQQGDQAVFYFKPCATIKNSRQMQFAPR